MQRGRGFQIFIALGGKRAQQRYHRKTKIDGIQVKITSIWKNIRLECTSQMYFQCVWVGNECTANKGSRPGRALQIRELCAVPGRSYGKTYQLLVQSLPIQQAVQQICGQSTCSANETIQLVYNQTCLQSNWLFGCLLIFFISTLFKMVILTL